MMADGECTARRLMKSATSVHTEPLLVHTCGSRRLKKEWDVFALHTKRYFLSPKPEIKLHQSPDKYRRTPKKTPSIAFTTNHWGAETTLCRDPGGDQNKSPPKPKSAPTAAAQGLLIELFVKQPKFWKKATTLGVHGSSIRWLGDTWFKIISKTPYCAMALVCLPFPQRYKLTMSF